MLAMDKVCNNKGWFFDVTGAGGRSVAQVLE